MIFVWIPDRWGGLRLCDLLHELEGFDYLSNPAGWEIGAGASITVLDQALAESISSSTTQEGIYAAFFAQQGLMGGVSLEGQKLLATDRVSSG